MEYMRFWKFIKVCLRTAVASLIYFSLMCFFLVKRYTNWEALLMSREAYHNAKLPSVGRVEQGLNRVNH